MLRIAFYNILGLIGVVVLIELVFGTWFSQTHALYQFTKPRDLQIVQENPLGDDPVKITYTRDVNGFRGLGGTVDQIDLITVGGSTTDQRFLDDAQTFQSVMKALFADQDRAFLIANAGIDGQSTFGHIANFESWFSQIDGLKTRYVLFYVGINDLLIFDQNQNYDNTNAQSLKLRVQLFVREKSIFYQTYRVLKGVFKSPEISHSVNQPNLAIAPPFVTEGMRPADVLQAENTLSDLQALSARVEELARLTRGIGATPIFVTQRSGAWTRMNDQVVGIPTVGPGFFNQLIRRVGPINGIDVYNIERAVARAVMSACNETQAICLDLGDELNFNVADDFYDEFHTTQSGSAAIGAYLFKKLVEKGV